MIYCKHFIFCRMALASVLVLLAASAQAQGAYHSGDTNQDYRLDLGELLQVIQFYNTDALHCDAGSSEGYAVGVGEQSCTPHSADYAPQDWTVNLSELLRSISLYNSRAYYPCAEGEDGFCHGESVEGETPLEGEGGIEGVVEGGVEEGEPVDTMEMVPIAAGTFTMGRSYDAPGGFPPAFFDNELPAHEVYLDAYEIGKYEVTNSQFVRVLNWALAKGYIQADSLYESQTLLPDPSPRYNDQILFFLKDNWNSSRISFRDDAFISEPEKLDHPVTEVSWYGCVAYCNWLSEMEGLDPCYDLSDWSRHEPVRNGYRPPTEAEWERAAAWDGSQLWRYGFSSNEISRPQANYEYSSATYRDRSFTLPVGWFNGINVLTHPYIGGEMLTMDSKSPSGCYDMSGNVLEWCHDRYDPNYYSISPRDNPTGPATGLIGVLRGGSLLDHYLELRTVSRDSSTLKIYDNFPHCIYGWGEECASFFSTQGIRVARTP